MAQPRLGAQVPGEQYKYWVGQHESVWSFQAPLQPAPDAAFSFVVYGDMGEADHKAAKSPGCAFLHLRTSYDICASP